METTALQTISNARRSVRKQFKSVEAFVAWASGQKFNYELVNHRAVRKPMIKKNELMIIWWLNRFFKQTKAYKEDAALVAEVGMQVITENFRIPDLAYFTYEQCSAAAKGAKVIPDLAIEILSKSETVEEVAEKLTDYFASGVKVVWYIYPKAEQIYVYTSPKNITVCEGEDICSAAPALSDFEFPAAMIFKKER